MGWAVWSAEDGEGGIIAASMRVGLGFDFVLDAVLVVSY